MKVLICTTLLLIASIALSAGKYDQLLKVHFTSSEMSNAHTARGVSYMTDQEKEVIQFMNLSRLYPLKFAAFYLDYLKTHEPSGYIKFKKKDKYYYSLYTDLLMLPSKKLGAFIPNHEMYKLALCWAKESGKKGVIGHDRKNCEKGYSSECCSYMYSSDAMDHVLLLLIDEDIVGVGHREAMFEHFRSVGVSMQPHKGYGQCAVLDFSRQEDVYAAR